MFQFPNFSLGIQFAKVAISFRVFTLKFKFYLTFLTILADFEFEMKL